MKIKELKLEKGLYEEARKNKNSFTEELEKLDPSAEYTGELASLDAYERQLASHGLEVSGGDASLVQDFFATNDSTILFPEFINRNVQLGMNKGKMEATLDDIVAARSTLDSSVYKGIAFDFAKSKTKYKRVAEGAEIASVTVKTKEKSINLSKIGLRLDSSYEAIRRVRLPVIAIAFQVIGQQLSRAMVGEGLKVLVNGDGNGNAATELSVATSGTLTLADMLDLDLAFDNFEGDTLIANKEQIKKLLLLEEFKHPLIGAEFLTAGKPSTPFGNKIRVAQSFEDNKILELAKNAGLEFLEERGASLVEVDKIIDRQMEKTVISQVVGFSKLFADSAFVLKTK